MLISQIATSGYCKATKEQNGREIAENSSIISLNTDALQDLDLETDLEKQCKYLLEIEPSFNKLLGDYSFLDNFTQNCDNCGQ